MDEGLLSPPGIPHTLKIATSWGSYLEGQGDLLGRLIMGVIGVTIWVVGVINLLTSPPDPPSKSRKIFSIQRKVLGSSCSGHAMSAGPQGWQLQGNHVPR